jgi:hypothetical protein
MECLFNGSCGHNKGPWAPDNRVMSGDQLSLDLILCPSKGGADTHRVRKSSTLRRAQDEEFR